MTTTEVVLVTVCTQPTGWFRALKRSAKNLGYRLVVLGQNEQWQGFMWRVRLTEQFLASLPPDSLFCSVDAYDVILLTQGETTGRPLFSLCPANHRRRWCVASTTSPRGTGRPLCSGWRTRTETHCRIPGADCMAMSPRLPAHNKRCRPATSKVSLACSNGRIINAGLWMGYPPAAQRLLQLWQRPTINSPTTDDQKALNSLCFLLQSEGLIVFDEAGDLFYHDSCTGLWDLLTQRCPPSLQGDCLQNPVTGRRPVMIHGPGGLDLDPVCDRLGLPRGDRRMVGQKLSFVSLLKQRPLQMLGMLWIVLGLCVLIALIPSIRGRRRICECD